MKTQYRNLPDWMETNAWREILARIFAGVEAQLNITPEWLINPTTNRRLKLDILYPDLGVAIRFEGLRGKQQRRRLSLEEEDQLRTRQDARVEICQQHGIQLVVIESGLAKPGDVFRQIDTAFSRAGQVMSDAGISQKLKTCRTTASSLSRKINRPADLKVYADLWHDRQYQVPEPSHEPPVNSETITFAEGMEVEHERFGPGIVLSITPAEGDTFVTVDFITAGQKTLAASLVGDKMTPK
ncbi:MAG: hypothetical protein H6633_22575 [Anaerolineales bacterium]|nr:hypothetical protein [Anaerolineales bacterium]